VLGKEHGEAFVVAHPAGVVASTVGQVRREQSVQPVIRKLPLQRLEADLLQDHVAVGIGQDFLVNAVASAGIRVGQFKGGNAGLERHIFKGAMPFLLGEKIASVGDNESHVARARLVDARKVDLVEDAVTQREPDFTVLVEGGAGAHLGARSPARRNAGPPRSETNGGITHELFVLGPGMGSRWK